MMGAILFVVACLAWQAVKNAMRGGPRPTVRLKEEYPALGVGEVHAVARCGCDTVNNKVVRPCEAHKAMMEI